MNYITSTCSSDMVFPRYRKDGPKSMSAISTGEIRIKGGANVTDKYSLMVPNGMITEVSDEDLEYLQNDAAFKRMVDKGFLKVTSINKLDQNLNGMTEKDTGAQILDSDHAATSDTLAYYGPGDKHHVTGQTPAGFRA